MFFDKGSYMVEKGLRLVVWPLYQEGMDNTMLPSLSVNILVQIKPMEDAMRRVFHLMDYLAIHQDTKIRYHESEMILNIHLDNSYFSE